MHDPRQHGHHGPHSPHSKGGDGPLLGAVLVNVLLTVAQVVGGIVSGSLSLIADALHNLNDAGALVVALAARRVARRPADKKRTFGYRRAEVVGALINLTTLVIVGLYLLGEAVSRFLHPQPVDGWIVVWIAGLALVVDVVTAVLTYRLSKGSLNIRAAFVHNVSDALASLTVIAAGTLILLYEWTWTDLVATILIAAYVLYHGFSMMRQTLRILLDSVPHDVKLEEVSETLTELDGVADVHHLHVWQLDEEHRALEVHIVLADREADAAQVKADARRVLLQRFGIGHSTLELELLGEEAECHNEHEGPDCFEPRGRTIASGSSAELPD